MRIQGTRALTCTRSGHVHLWDLEASTCVLSEPLHQGAAYAVRFASPDTSLSCGLDGALRLFDLRSGDAEQQEGATLFQHPEHVYCCEVLGNLALTGTQSSLHLWDLRRSDAPLLVWDTGKSVFSVYLDELKVLATTLDSTVLCKELDVADPSPPTPLWTCSGKLPIYGVGVMHTKVAFGVGSRVHVLDFSCNARPHYSSSIRQTR
mgnify:FL=1